MNFEKLENLNKDFESLGCSIRENQLIYLTENRKAKMLSDYYLLKSELLNDIDKLKEFEKGFNTLEQSLRDIEILKQ